METKQIFSDLLDNIEESLNDKIKNTISDLVKEASLNFEKVLNSINSKANVLEHSLKTELKLAKVTLKISENYNDKSFDLPSNTKTMGQALSLKSGGEKKESSFDLTKEIVKEKVEIEQTEEMELIAECKDVLESTKQPTDKQERPKTEIEIAFINATEESEKRDSLEERELKPVSKQDINIQTVSEMSNNILLDDPTTKTQESTVDGSIISLESGPHSVINKLLALESYRDEIQKVIMESKKQELVSPISNLSNEINVKNGNELVLFEVQSETPESDVFELSKESMEQMEAALEDESKSNIESDDLNLSEIITENDEIENQDLSSTDNNASEEVVVSTINDQLAAMLTKEIAEDEILKNQMDESKFTLDTIEKEQEHTEVTHTLEMETKSEENTNQPSITSSMGENQVNSDSNESVLTPSRKRKLSESRFDCSGENTNATTNTNITSEVIDIMSQITSTKSGTLIENGLGHEETENKESDDSHKVQSDKNASANCSPEKKRQRMISDSKNTGSIIEESILLLETTTQVDNDVYLIRKQTSEQVDQISMPSVENMEPQSESTTNLQSNEESAVTSDDISSIKIAKEDSIINGTLVLDEKTVQDVVIQETPLRVDVDEVDGSTCSNTEMNETGDTRKDEIVLDINKGIENGNVLVTQPEPDIISPSKTLQTKDNEPENIDATNNVVQSKIECSEVAITVALRMNETSTNTDESSIESNPDIGSEQMDVDQGLELELKEVIKEHKTELQETNENIKEEITASNKEFDTELNENTDQSKQESKEPRMEIETHGETKKFKEATEGFDNELKVEKEDHTGKSENVTETFQAESKESEAQISSEPIEMAKELVTAGEIEGKSTKDEKETNNEVETESNKTKQKSTSESKEITDLEVKKEDHASDSEQVTDTIQAESKEIKTQLSSEPKEMTKEQESVEQIEGNPIQDEKENTTTVETKSNKMKEKSNSGLKEMSKEFELDSKESKEDTKNLKDTVEQSKKGIQALESKKELCNAIVYNKSQGQEVKEEIIQKNNENKESHKVESKKVKEDKSKPKESGIDLKSESKIIQKDIEPNSKQNKEKLKMESKQVKENVPKLKEIKEELKSAAMEEKVTVPEGFQYGDIVWGTWMRRWYAATVADPLNIPKTYLEKLNKMKINKKDNPADFHIVQFFVDGTYAKVHKSKVEALGELAADKAKGKKDAKGYSAALEVLKNEKRHKSSVAQGA